MAEQTGELSKLCLNTNIFSCHQEVIGKDGAVRLDADRLVYVRESSLRNARLAKVDR